jgi:hypothetical protein
MAGDTQHFMSDFGRGVLFLVTIGLMTPRCLQTHGASGDSRGAISLAGAWRFKADPADAGVGERWFARELAEVVRWPGSMAENGKGDEVSVNTKWTGGIVDRSWFTAPQYEQYRQPGSIKLPFWLTPTKHYVGAAWYQKAVAVPRAWRDRRIVLVLERCHWETELWVDENRVGSRNSLSTPHHYDLTEHLTPGRHRLTVRVDNRLKIDVGENAHSVSDHTQGNWNGIVGELKLMAGPKVWVDDLQVFPDVNRKVALLRLRLGNATSAAAPVKLTFGAQARNTKAAHQVAPKEVALTVAAGGGEVAAEYPLGAAAQLWDEFSPALYELSCELASDGKVDRKKVIFGLRQLGQQGTQFTINGRVMFLRGTLECCIFPRTGYPPTDVESWKRIIRVCQEHGLNHIRFHSWCPPEAAFRAADELGFYYHVECAAWANVDDPKFGEFLRAEGERIVREYGNHPSFCLMAYGNEPAGKNQNRFLGDWVSSWKAADPRRKYTSAAGWPNLAENDYQSTPAPRIQAWGGGLQSRINARPPETVTNYAEFVARFKVPIVSHEIGQWCVYPNLREIPKYRGTLKARNFEIFRHSLAAHHLLDQADDFLFASGRLQTLCYKEDIESALRTPGFGGFQLLDLHDFPGQGTALVGVLDPFWEAKGYVSPEEFHRFCCETVPLALMGKRVFANTEEFTAKVKVAHFGPAELKDAQVAWSLSNSAGEAVANGVFPRRVIPLGNDGTLGDIRAPLNRLPTAQKLVLTVSLTGTPYRNDWDVWVYPANVDPQPPNQVTIAEELDDQTMAKLARGEKVLLLIPPKRVAGDRLGRVALGFSSIFWNTAWTGRQAPHTLGILCDPKHAALAEFPTECHSNWQWWYLVSRAQAMSLEGLPPKLRPIVQVIDDWFTNRRLGLAFEARVGQGKLLVCSIDLKTELEQNLPARQMLHSLLQYMGSDRFQPKVEVRPEQIRALASSASPLEKAGARVIHTDSAEPGHEGALAIDGDPTTLWHTAWTKAKPGFPHDIQVGFEQPTKLAGFTVLPRQDGNPNGWIKDYAFYVADDATDWGEAVARGSFTNDAKLKTVWFEKPCTGRFIRLVALAGFDTGPWASLAELDLLGVADLGNR